MMISSCIKDIVRQEHTNFSEIVIDVNFLAIIFLRYESRELKKFIPFDLAILPLGICSNKRTRNGDIDLCRKHSVLFLITKDGNLLKYSIY